VFRETLPQTFLALGNFCGDGPWWGGPWPSTIPHSRNAFSDPRMIETIERHEMWTDSIVGIQTAGKLRDHDKTT